MVAVENVHFLNRFSVFTSGIWHLDSGILSS